MSRQKTQSQAIHAQAKNTRRKPTTALKRRKTRITCRSKTLTRISIGKWGLVTMKKKKAVGRSRRVKGETGLKTEVVADHEKGTVTTVAATNPNTKQTPMREKGVEGESEAGVPRNPKTKKSLSTGER